jgi:integrase
MKLRAQGSQKQFQPAETTISLQASESNLKRITLHTFRHFYATKLYHSTKDILLVKERLG